MAAKRKLEFSDYSELDEEAGNADIHWVITQLSPVKPKRETTTVFPRIVSARRIVSTRLPVLTEIVSALD